MRKSFFFLTLSFFVLMTACTQTRLRHLEQPALVSINIIDRNGLSETINNPERLEQYSCVDFLTPQPYQKVLRVFNRDSCGNIPACITSYHPNGTPKQCLEVVNGRACGSYQEWYLNGVLKISAMVIEGSGDIVEGAELSWIFDGCCSVWDENGTLIALIPYVKGSQEGVAMYYHSDGSIWKTIPSQNGLMEGAVEIYNSDGTLLQRSHYCRGLLDGRSERYWGIEKLSAEEVYFEGLLSSGHYYDQDGQCISQIDEGNGTRVIFSRDRICEEHEYRSGVLEGEITVFDKSGCITRLYHV
jgi:antitoxin component YwqK of YwqJK toxin-antitoxin module